MGNIWFYTLFVFELAFAISMAVAGMIKLMMVFNNRMTNRQNTTTRK